MRAESVEEAVKLINGRDKPLALYVFTGRDKVADLFTQHTSSGGLCINDTIMHLGVEELPFGGVGASGMGAYHGKHGFDTFTHYKVGQLSYQQSVHSVLKVILHNKIRFRHMRHKHSHSLNFRQSALKYTKYF